MSFSHLPALLTTAFFPLAHWLQKRSAARLPRLLIGILFAHGRRTVTSWFRAADEGLLAPLEPENSAHANPRLPSRHGICVLQLRAEGTSNLPNAIARGKNPFTQRGDKAPQRHGQSSRSALRFQAPTRALLASSVSPPGAARGSAKQRRPASSRKGSGRRLATAPAADSVAPTRSAEGGIQDRIAHGLRRSASISAPDRPERFGCFGQAATEPSHPVG